MADTNDAYQRSIGQAAKIYANASESYNAIKEQLDQLAATPADVQAGGAKEAQYATLQKQLQTAQQRFNDAEKAYQDAIQLQDKAKTAAKETYPAGATRTRLDTTAGNVLVAVTETADGRGGWNVDPTSIHRVQVGGQTPGTRISAPTGDKFIVTMNDDGTLSQKDNPNYQPDRNAAPSAVPTSEFIWQDGQIQTNPAYRPPQPAPRTPEQQRADAAQAATAEATAANAPAVAAANAATATANATTATAAAGTAQQTAETNLRRAQADAATAEQNLAEAVRRSSQAPSPAQAQQAIQQALTAADLANKKLEAELQQSANLNPTVIEQAQATLASTRQAIAASQANVQKDKLGDVYGLRDRIKEVRDLVASGEISDKEGDAMVDAVQRGTTIYDVLKQSQADKTAARGQDVSLANQKTGTFGSMFSSGLSTLADMNKYAAAGSSAGADAFVALLNMAQDRLKSYDVPAAQSTNYLRDLPGQSGVGGMANLAAQQVTPPPAPQPTGTGAQPITINIGSGAASNPQPQVPYQPVTPTYNNTPETSAASTARNTGIGGLVGAAQNALPVTNGEALKTLYPNVARQYQSMGVL